MEVPAQWDAATVCSELFEQRYRADLAQLWARARRILRKGPPPPVSPLRRTVAASCERLNQINAARVRFEAAPPFVPPSTTPEELQIRLDQLVEDMAALLHDRQLFVGEVKNKYKAYLFAKDYYKTKLNMYYTIEDSADNDNIIIFVQFFTSKKLKSDNHSVVFHKTKSNNSFQLKEMNPHLPIFNQLQQRLKETGDIIGLVCCIRRCFKQYYKSNSIH